MKSPAATSNVFAQVTLMALLAASPACAQDENPAPVKKADVPANAVAQPAMPKGVAELNKGRGSLFVKEDTWDFGYVAQDVKITHEFILQNVGKDTLFIERIKPT